MSKSARQSKGILAGCIQLPSRSMPASPFRSSPHRTLFLLVAEPDGCVVTRKGQTTISVNLHKKYRIVEGSKLEVIDCRGVLLKPKLSFFDLGGSGSSKATVKEMKELLDRLRDEDA
jgi:bifunctional DNA-binding transcriptional regulator/antitoxin component of YhaV-PrlF toxin-antitoxin module